MDGHGWLAPPATYSAPAAVRNGDSGAPGGRPRPPCRWRLADWAGEQHRHHRHGRPADDGPGPFHHEETGRDAAPQFVLPLVARIERAEPPGAYGRAGDGGARGARAAVRRAVRTGDGEWAAGGAGLAGRPDPEGGAAGARRGVAAAEALPGITVTGASTPRCGSSRRCRWTAGRRIWRGSRCRARSWTTRSRPARPIAAGPVLWLNPELEMSAGKEMAQVGPWRAAGLVGAVRGRSARPGARPGSRCPCGPHRRRAWDALTRGGLPVVRDAGLHGDRPRNDRRRRRGGPHPVPPALRTAPAGRSRADRALRRCPPIPSGRVEPADIGIADQAVYQVVRVATGSRP